MATTGGPNATQVLLELDPRSINAIVDGISRAFTVAFTDANKIASAQMQQLSKDISVSMAVGQKAAQSAASSIGKNLKGAASTGSTAFEKMVDKFAASLVDLNRATGVIVSELQRVSQLERRASIDATQAATDAARLQIANVRNVGIQTNIEGQKAVVVARGAAKSRVLITQGMVRSIVLLEKGIGKTIEGVARTTVSAISKIFSGVTGAFRRDTSGIDAEMRRTNAAIARGVKQGNTEFTSGVSGALNKREGLMRSSFREQETIVTRSVLRQREALAGLRTGTQTGVLGAANRGLNIGSLIGGFAVIQAARSTFKIGAEFTRGMAVLQAQLNLTGDEMKSVRQLSIDLGNDIKLPGVSALDASEAIQLLAKQFASLGPAAITAAEDAAKGTLQLSRAANVGAEEAAGIVGAAVNVFGIAASEATAVADQVTAALKNAAGVSFGDFADAFKQAGAVFAQFQKPAVGATEALLEFDTAIAVIARAGVVGSDAGTSLKQFFLQANRAAPAAQSALTGLTERAGETGTAFFDAAGKARPFEKTLDILRKGLVGLTDQQRSSALQTIFGSDAIRVANALLGVSTEEYSKVTASLREQGLASKIAAAQNTGLKGALDALRSVMETVQILLFGKVNPALGKFVLAIAATVNVVLFGKGAWATLRQGLLGVAAGLGAVLAVRGVVEVFQQLGRVVTLVATPFGAFLAIAALVGGAVFILAKHSESFRDALRSLRENLEDFAGVAKDRVVTALHNIRDVIARDIIPPVIGALGVAVQFISRRVLPVLRAVGAFAVDHVVAGFRIAVRFIRNTLLPTLKTVGKFIAENFVAGLHLTVDFVRNTVIPALGELVIFLTSSLTPALVAISVLGGVLFGPWGVAIAGATALLIQFRTQIIPIIQPIIDGFKTLGTAVASAFGGDFSKLGSGFIAAGTGFAAAFSNIGKVLLRVLDVAWLAVQAFFKRVFSGPNLISLGKGFLDFVEWVGRALGSIVTSPTFIKAVVLIGAAAALIAVRFAEGFAKAFLHNLPGLMSLLGKALLGGIIAIFSNPLIAIGIGLAIAAVLRVVALVKAFQAAGTSAGGGFLGGLKGALSKSVFSARSGALQFRSIFDGQAFTRYAKEQGFQAGRALVKEFGRNNALLRTANIPGLGPVKGSISGFFTISQKQADEAAKRIDEVRKRLGPVGAAALESRTNVQSLIRTFQGFGPAISGIGATFAKFRTSGDTFFGSLHKAFSGAIQKMKDVALLEGGSVGRALLQGIKGAMVGGAAVVGGFVAGKAEGQSGGSGLTSALLTGLTVGALTTSPALGVLAGAATLVGAAFGRAEGKAKAFREEVQRLTKTFADDLVKAIETGQIKLDGLKLPKSFGIGNILGIPDAFDQAVQSFADNLKPEQIKAILDANVGGIRGIVKLLQQSGNDVDRFSENFRKQFLANSTSTDLFRKKFGTNAGGVSKVLADILKPGGNASIKDFLDGHDFKNLHDPIVGAIRDNKDFLQTILSTSGAVTTYAGGFAEAAQNAGDLAVAIAKIPPLPKFTNLSFEHGLPTKDPFPGLVAGAKAYAAEVKKSIGQGARLFKQLVDLGVSAEDANAELEKIGLPKIPQPIIDDWNKQLSKVQAKAEALRAVVEGIPNKLGEAVAAALNLPSTVSTAEAVVTVTADVSSIVDVVGTIADGITTPQGVLAINRLGLDVGNAAGIAITQHLVVDDASLQAFLTDLNTQAVAGITDQGTIDAINNAFVTAFATIQPTLPGDLGAVAGAELAAQINAYMLDNPFVTQIQAEFVVSLKPVVGEGALGTRRQGLVAPEQKSLLDGLLLTPAEIADFQTKTGDAIRPVGEFLSTSFADSIKSPASHAVIEGAAREVAGAAVTTGKANSDMRPAGESFQTSFASGIKAPTSRAAVVAAAKAMAAAAVKAAKDQLAMGSPSKVMMEVGGFFIDGLTQGINDGSAAAAAAAAGAAQAAVDAARGVVENNPLVSSFSIRRESIDDRAIRDAKNVAGAISSANPELPGVLPGLTPGAAAGLTNQWLDTLTPDIKAIIDRGISDGSITNTADAQAALQDVLQTITGGFDEHFAEGPLWDTVNGIIVGRFDTAAKDAAARVEANNQRMLGHGVAVGQSVMNTNIPPGFQGLSIVGAGLAAQVHPGDDTSRGALKTHQELADLVTLARSLVATAEALNKRGPDVTNVAITEAKDARSTARATIAELRADRLLMKGVR